MREIFFDENSVNNGLRQAYDRLVREGFDSYTILGIGDGGKQIAQRLLKCGIHESILSCTFENSEPIIPDRSGIFDKNILVCDDTTITGRTFLKVNNKLKEYGAADIKFLSFLMRKNSLIVPNIYIFETEEDTKVYFPWSDYPIRTYPKGIVRKMLPADVGKNFRCGDPRIDKNSLTDFYKNQKHAEARVYLVEDQSEICSIIQFYENKINDHKGLFLDTIATAHGKQGNKYGSTLLKLILSYMIYHEFDFIYGYAFDDDNLMTMYKSIGFEKVGSVLDPHYGILYKMITVNGTKAKKEIVINAIRAHI